MQGSMLFKKFLMPCGLCASVPVMKPAQPPQDCPTACSNPSQPTKMMRPSELPIYSIQDDYSKQIPCTDCSPSGLEQQISKVRKSLQGVVGEYQHLTDTVVSKIDTGMEHSRFLVDYLRDEMNVLPRVGAIGIGGLTGLMLSIRGGTFKRLVYTSTFAGAVGAACYPKKAEEGFNMAKHYANVSYNFIYGVKPGDGKQLENILPELPKLKMPTSTSEFVELITSTSSTIVAAITDLIGQSTKSTNELKEKDNSSLESKTKQD